MSVSKYVSSEMKMVEIMKNLQLPFKHVVPGEEVLIITDTSMDPLVWRSVMATVAQRGAEPTVALYLPRAHHTAEPTKITACGANGAQIVVLLTTKALAHSEFTERKGKWGLLLMEEITVDILSNPICSINEEDYRIITEREQKIRNVWKQGGDLHLTTPFGTDLRAKLVETPTRSVDPAPGILAKNEKTGGRGGSTWPYGENRVTPLEGSGEGTVVWDLCGHTPEGFYQEPVRLTVKGGRVVKMEGGKEARAVERYFAEHGDENWNACPAEISIGTNHKGVPLGAVRSDKKVLGTVHVAIGHSDVGGNLYSKTHFDGLMTKPTIRVNDTLVTRDGIFQL